jgi:26S proteasome regulatory subunit T1
VEHHRKTHGEYSSVPISPVLVTISPSPEPPTPARPTGSPYLSIRIRDQGGGVSAANMARIFSYAFTTAGRTVGAGGADESGGGPYAAQHHGGAGDSTSGGSLFSELASQGLQSSLGTIAGLGYGLPMSRLYAEYALSCCRPSHWVDERLQTFRWIIGPAFTRWLGLGLRSKTAVSSAWIRR